MGLPKNMIVHYGEIFLSYIRFAAKLFFTCIHELPIMPIIGSKIILNHLHQFLGVYVGTICLTTVLIFSDSALQTLYKFSN